MSDPRWQKSSFSESGSDSCLEITTGPEDTLHLREGATPETVLTTTPARLRALLTAIRAGTLQPGA